MRRRRARLPNHRLPRLGLSDQPAADRRVLVRSVGQGREAVLAGEQGPGPGPFRVGGGGVGGGGHVGDAPAEGDGGGLGARAAARRAEGGVAGRAGEARTGVTAGRSVEHVLLRVGPVARGWDAVRGAASPVRPGANTAAAAAAAAAKGVRKFGVAHGGATGLIFHVEEGAVALHLARVEHRDLSRLLLGGRRLCGSRLPAAVVHRVG